MKNAYKCSFDFQTSTTYLLMSSTLLKTFFITFFHNHNLTVYPWVLRTGGWQGRVFEVCLVLG